MSYEDHDSDSVAVSKGPCPDCGSPKGLTTYSDGHSYCFSHCDANGNGYKPPPGDFDPNVSNRAQRSSPTVSVDFITGTIPEAGIPSRGLTSETCKKFNYRVARVVGNYGEEDIFQGYREVPEGGKKVHVETITNSNGERVAQHLRFIKEKGFSWIGRPQGAALFGQSVWRSPHPNIGLTITEGAIDAMSCSQVQKNEWPCVSINDGAGKQSLNGIKAQLPWIEKWNHVTLCFDMDEPGQASALEIAEFLSAYTTVRIAKLPEPFKDANEMLMAGEVAGLIKALRESREFSIEGVLEATELKREWMTTTATHAVTWPWKGLSAGLIGLRAGELYTITADTGVGKTAFTMQVIEDLLKKGERVGAMFLEQGGTRTLDGLVGLKTGERIHLQRAMENMPDEIKALRPDIGAFDKEKAGTAYDELFGQQNLFIDNHWGSSDFEKLIGKIRHMIVAKGCKWIVLDHISIAVSGMDIDDERKALDVACTRIADLTETTGATVIMVCHLRRPQGAKSFDEGQEVSLGHLRGTQAIGQLSWTVLALERPKKHPVLRDFTKVACLKDRFAGDADGKTIAWLKFNVRTGRLEEVHEDVVKEALSEYKKEKMAEKAIDLGPDDEDDF